MARAKPDLASAMLLRALADPGGRLAVRVTPGARSESVAIVDGRVLVRVRAVPEAGKANAAVLALLAEALDCPRTALTVFRGESARDKLIALGEV